MFIELKRNMARHFDIYRLLSLCVYLFNGRDTSDRATCKHHSLSDSLIVSVSLLFSQLSRTFDNKYQVPPAIMAIYVDLADKTEFEVHNGLFQQNRVNMFMIDGHHGNNQVELTANFLGGNLAGYPDVQLVNVGHSFLRPEAFSSE